LLQVSVTLSQPLRDPPYLKIRDVSHRFGSQLALESVSLELPKGQILALLGPSGSGKSTLLAVIAGLIQPTTGEIWLGEEAITHLPPERRDLGMVFQDYALWPHMTVTQNIAFPLRQKGIPTQQIRERVRQALAQVELTGFEDRYPAELSGGQQQRVALARAVVAEPRLLLLDEPFSALDPGTRSAVRAEIGLLLRRLGLTTILVTHDREEAFELSDQVAILLKGRIQQCAPPQEVYERPSHPAVATFLGLNLLRVQPGSTHRRVRIGERELEVLNPEEMPLEWIAIAPERVQVLPYRRSLSPQQLLGWVRDACYSGGEYRLTVEIEGSPAQFLRARASFKPQETHVVVELPVAALHGLGSGAHSPLLAGIRSG
jgi:ABC-type Fe3+/spermidine/putrescine transport system ATPase subunit